MRSSNTLFHIYFMIIELRLSNIRLGRHGDATNDEDPTTSGRFSQGLFSGRFSGRSTASDVPDSTVSKAPKVLMAKSFPSHPTLEVY